jgi:hypothetical protein
MYLFPFVGLQARHLVEVPECAYIEGQEIASPLKGRIYVSVFILINGLLRERRSPYTKRPLARGKRLPDTPGLNTVSFLYESVEIEPFCPV